MNKPALYENYAREIISLNSYFFLCAANLIQEPHFH